MIDTSKCSFTGVPKYFTSLQGGDDGHRFIYSEADILIDADGAKAAKGFRVNMRSTRGVSVGQAQNGRWKLNWCGVGPSKEKPKSYQMCCGASSTNWQNHDGVGAYNNVDASGCGWSWGKDADRLGEADRDLLVPMFFADVSDSAGGWSSRYTGAAAIYNPRPTGFDTILYPFGGQRALYGSYAQSEGFRVQWCGLKPLPPVGEAAASGYPCTAPKLLVGGADQSTYSNSGNICCDSTDSSNWHDANDGLRIWKRVDLSKCPLRGVRVLLTSVVSSDGSVQKMGGASSYSNTADPNVVILHLLPTISFRAFSADRFNFRVQYCAIGA